VTCIPSPSVPTSDVRYVLISEEGVRVPIHSRPSPVCPADPPCMTYQTGALHAVSIARETRMRFTSNKRLSFSSRSCDMPYALCSNSECRYSIELHDRSNGVSIATPEECPRCRSSMIVTCPECGFLLLGRPGAPVCPVCLVDIRGVFEKQSFLARPAHSPTI
jgi:hypothetical protein